MDCRIFPPDINTLVHPRTFPHGHFPIHYFDEFGNDLIINWILLFTVLSITPALNFCHLCFTPTRQLPSIFSPSLVSRLLSPLVVFGMLANLFGNPSLLILDLSTPPPSNPISKFTCCVWQTFLAPNNSIRALLIHIYMLILAPKLFYNTLQCCWIVLCLV